MQGTPRPRCGRGREAERRGRGAAHVLNARCTLSRRFAPTSPATRARCTLGLRFQSDGPSEARRPAPTMSPECPPPTGQPTPHAPEQQRTRSAPPPPVAAGVHAPDLRRGKPMQREPSGRFTGRGRHPDSPIAQTTDRTPCTCTASPPIHDPRLSPRPSPAEPAPRACRRGSPARPRPPSPSARSAWRRGCSRCSGAAG